MSYTLLPLVKEIGICKMIEIYKTQMENEEQRQYSIKEFVIGGDYLDYSLDIKDLNNNSKQSFDLDLYTQECNDCNNCNGWCDEEEIIKRMIKSDFNPNDIDNLPICYNSLTIEYGDDCYCWGGDFVIQEETIEKDIITLGDVLDVFNSFQHCNHCFLEVIKFTNENTVRLNCGS